MKVLHVITGLSAGGAEMMLYRLLSASDRNTFVPEVVSLIEASGPVATKVRNLGIPVASMGMPQGVPDPRAISRLARYIRGSRPDVIQTWMYHADLLGALAARLVGRMPVVWGVQHSTLDPDKSKRTTILTAQACAFVSRSLPARIISCSEVARSVHIRLGYSAEKLLVIPNGFDLSIFQPDPAARPAVRAELGLPPETPLIGLFARFNPQKDHQNFVLAAQRLHQKLPEAHYVLCGNDVTWDNAELAGWIDAAEMRSHIHLLGLRDDIPRLMAALDVGGLSSRFGEGFPVVLGEAMACAVPCVVTDVGDSAMIVSDTGIVVPPQDPHALAAGWHKLLTMDAAERAALGQRARQRVAEHFSLPSVVSRYEAVYRMVGATM